MACECEREFIPKSLFLAEPFTGELEFMFLLALWIRSIVCDLSDKCFPPTAANGTAFLFSVPLFC